MKNLSAALALMLVLLTTTVSAQSFETKNVRIKTVSEQYDGRAVKDLIRGIKSDNEGLRKSCIYMAGFYEIRECASALVEQLEVEENADTRILIALSLFRIGDNNAMGAVEKLSLSDTSAKVRRISRAILTETEKSGSLYSAINSIK